jgi:hypothetical protein
MCTPIERMRCLMQRNCPGAAPCKCELVNIPAKFYRDTRGHMVTLLELNPKRALFRRAGGELCTLNRAVFERKFKKVQE